VIDMNISMEGLDAIRRAFDQLPGAIQDGVEKAAETMRNLTIGRTPYLTGHLLESWSLLRPSGGGFTFGTDVPYAITLEEGLYPWAETERTRGGYSKWAQGGIIGPLLEDEKVLQQLVALIIEQMKRGMGIA